MRKEALITAVLSLSFLASCGGGGGGDSVNDDTTVGSGPAGFVNVSGSISTSSVSGQSLGALAGCNISVGGQTPAYIVAVTTDQNGRVTAAGSQIDQSCAFNLSLNKNYSYAFAVFSQSGQPLVVFADPSGKNAMKFTGDVSLTAVLKDTNNDGVPDTAEVSVDNPVNVTFSTDNNLNQAVQNPPDRDGNGKADYMDDLNNNGVPDALEDRNGNGRPDSLEDWDGNGHPEGLEDENQDGIPDHVEDDNMNGHPEHHDCNGNGRFDDETNEGYEGNEDYSCGQPPAGGNQGGGNQGTVSFSADVLPILNQSCAGCHGSNGNFHLSTATDKYAEVMKFVNTANPSNSRLLLKATNTISHGGGMVLSTQSPEYQKILQWIQSGAPNN